MIHSYIQCCLQVNSIFKNCIIIIIIIIIISF